MNALRSVAWLSLVFCLLLGQFGCGDSTTTPPDPGGTPSASPTRIVSLAPALTRMIQDLGGGGLIVGGDDSHLKVFASFEQPTVGQFNQINSEAIIALKPTHVLAMVGQEGVPAELETLAKSNNFKLVTFAYPTSVRDVEVIMRGPPVVDQTGKMLVGEESLAFLVNTDPLMANRVVNDMVARLGQIDALTSTVAPPGDKPRVVLVMALEPEVRAIGPKTVLHDVLTSYAGAYNAAIPEHKPMTPEEEKDPELRKAYFERLSKDPADLVGPAPVMTREMLLDAKPDVILLILPGEPPIEVPDLDPRLADFKGLDIPAVKNDRVLRISSPQSQLPSTTLPQVAADMAKAIHPSLTAPIDKLMAPPAPEPDPTDPPAQPGTSEKIEARTSVNAE